MALSDDGSQAQVARELGVKENCLYNWIGQSRGEVLSMDHDMTPEQELAALK